MRFEKIILHKYKPFLHGGPTTLSIDFSKTVIPIIGNNGSGKSSLLRAISVFPPISTDFENGGYKEVHVSHAGHDYILRSEFDKNKSTHIFMMNGKDLNVAQNSTAQTSLCESYFGISTLLKELTSGNINLSQISRALRKDILLACYPSDLTFILEHHKKVSSRLRAVKSNIKMMNVRLQEVTDKLMDEEEYTSLVRLDEGLVSFQSDVDSWMYRFEQDIVTLKGNEHYKPHLGRFDVDQFRSENNKFRKEISSIPITTVYSEEDATSKASVIESALELRSQALDDLDIQIKKLVKEIDEYEELANDNIDDEIVKTNAEIEDLEKSISKAKLDKSLPVIDLPGNHETILYDMNAHIVALHGCEGDLITSTKITSIESELSAVNMEGASIVADIKRQEKTIGAVKERIHREKAMTYNAQCNMTCPLKSNYLTAIGELEASLNEYETIKSNLNTNLNGLRQKKESLVKAISGPKQVLDSIRYMESFYIHNSWCSHISDSMEEFISMLGMNASNVYNSISRIFANARLTETIKNLNKDLETVNYRLKVLVDNKLPTKNLISKGLVDKRTSLKQLRDRYIESHNLHSKMSLEFESYSKLSRVRNEFKNFSDLSVSKMNSALVGAKLNDLEHMISDLRKYKQAAISKKSEIASVLKEQSHLRIRLSEEINPNLKSLEEEKERLEILEATLSPNSGLPHIYLTRFINSILRTANNYIETVWNYDLKFKELSEDKVLDFSFPITLHGNSGANTLSSCSKGEQEMLNLAFTLAICVHMRISDKYPVKLDEVDSGFSAEHRDRLLTLLSNMVREGLIKQLILVNHFSTLFTAFANSQVICLNPDGIAVPSVYNEGVSIN